MEFDYDFFKDIVLVAIPVAAGAILTPVITRIWQTRSAKIKIKKEEKILYHDKIE